VTFHINSPNAARRAPFLEEYHVRRDGFDNAQRLLRSAKEEGGSIVSVPINDSRVSG
jgi:hypothetical protein